MGVNLILTFLLLTISYINAQDYVMLDETEYNEWDLSYDNPNFLDQGDHVIHKRDAPDSDLEGSGESELPGVLPEPLNNKTSDNLNDETLPSKDKDEEDKPNEKSDVPVAIAEPLNNETSDNVENKIIPSEENAEEEKHDETPVQISNFAPASLPVIAEETPKSNETNTEPDAPSVQISNFAPASLPVIAEETPKSNETNTEPEAPSVPISNFAPASLPVIAEETPKSNETNTEPEEPSVQISNFAPASLPVIAEETPKSNETNTEPDEPSVQISNFAPASLPVIAEETPKSNETKTELEAPSVDNVNVQTVDNETDLIIPATQSQITEEKSSVKPMSNETSNQTEKPEPVNSNESEKVSNETTGSPTRLPDIVIEQNSALPPLIHSVSNGSTSQQPEASETPKQSPKVPEKEGDIVISSSNNETKPSGKEEQTKVLPSDLAEAEYINNNKETEMINEQQSGSAVLLKGSHGDGASQVEGSESDKVLQGMAENAKISNEPTESPATGESAKNVSRAGKDTTILVVLFVVVIAIGGAAFTHNYIKKRKQNASANNDIVNGIRRSLQNLSSSNVKTNPDVEQGTELKPLMKNNSPTSTITKDYTDTKKEAKA